jgi:hypothetical protein
MGVLFFRLDLRPQAKQPPNRFAEVEKKREFAILISPNRRSDFEITVLLEAKNVRLMGGKTKTVSSVFGKRSQCAALQWLSTSCTLASVNLHTMDSKHW